MERRDTGEYRSMFPVEGKAGREPGAKTQSRIPAEVYRRYEHYYENSYDLYARLGEFLKWELAQSFGGLDRTVDPASPVTESGSRYLAMLPDSSVRNLRNPIHRVVEFYATTILTGTAEQAFEVEESTDAVKNAVKKVWEWSNLSQTKQELKRLVALYGEAYIKVVSPPDSDKVQLEFIEPEYVVETRVDGTRNIKYLRLEIPIPGHDAASLGHEEKKVHTEIWAKGNPADGKPGYCKVWERHEDTAKDTIPTEEALGAPKKTYKLTADSGGDSRTGIPGTGIPGTGIPDEKNLGFDFVPFVRITATSFAAKKKRAKPVYEHALPMIDQLNRRATRLDELLFRYNKPFKALEGIGNDPSGRPLPAPQLGNNASGGAEPKQGDLASGAFGQGPRRNQYAFGGSRGTDLHRNTVDISLGGDIMLGLPGNAKLSDVTPKLDFGAARQAVLDDIAELHEELPELLYYATRDKAQLSGRAMRTLLSGAVDRATEMKTNIESGVVKADKMALTVGQVRRLPGFTAREIGSYGDADGFVHAFKEREVLPVSDDEREEAKSKRITNAQGLIALGVKRSKVLEELGYGDEETDFAALDAADENGADMGRSRAALEAAIANGGGANAQDSVSGDARSVNARR